MGHTAYPLLANPDISIIHLSTDVRIRPRKKVTKILWQGYYLKNRLGYWYRVDPRNAHFKRMTTKTEYEFLDAVLSDSISHLPCPTGQAWYKQNGQWVPELEVDNG